ncbi:class I SAM-dependent methyltransferase [Parabacteroides sp. 52]|uniref:class I SAM-dependent methyltransferase n=1 Tax=unclassified Parabacteroides TaxID=2649774 RepID=UPI0013D1B6C9|nr:MULTISPECIES: class I SAM-dependent methyltransferase [unclassified Parabacteroides]MDH6533635.1 SAM-dependent methyltransferase [Parabacteroides sp. PM5-20]NDV54387.1 class I SAM-dependent methyltransferase [Parabacteroides sp. 52]
MKDIYGKGLLAYLNGDKNAVFAVESDMAETEEWPIETFFRTYKQMPQIEKLALNQVQGSVLDIGAGAGSHILWLQERGVDATAIDISPGAVEVMQRRGVKKVYQQDFFNYEGQKFDTLLMLMNGVGITGRLDRLPRFFAQAKQLLSDKGKILLDSSDIRYLFEEEEGDFIPDPDDPYYGELKYSFHFDGEKGDFFDWLFIDFDTLSFWADTAGFTCKKIDEDKHFLYLAELKRKRG